MLPAFQRGGTDDERRTLLELKNSNSANQERNTPTSSQETRFHPAIGEVQHIDLPVPSGGAGAELSVK